ncbi:hypothetical protein AVEN_31257-1 [Araneus ventricosus]|uniref:Uncharacterized protein n=1 Tax=Araneus ventricosus TaxID=182803 RepID=A0A4Y2IJG0_ARAVE|nr:hypothetical protein AVEN_31257-1 [Araneus ventricosus]
MRHVLHCQIAENNIRQTTCCCPSRGRVGRFDAQRFFGSSMGKNAMSGKGGEEAGSEECWGGMFSERVAGAPETLVMIWLGDVPVNGWLGPETLGSSDLCLPAWNVPEEKKSVVGDMIFVVGG